ncbi:MAG: HNH endonuclease [Actinomycetota bacterium]|nr:HNH endonuclease [Actinomycetota bacterium]MDH5224423.1 HNH endonuclease [Actinomycetota bacterium]MDH5313590.1 HNH endonuclease [Actinomycetota bacterium]
MYGSLASTDLDDDGLIGVADALNRHIAAAQVAMLGVIAEVDRREAWRDSGARDFPHWLSIRYGISWWKADRWIKAAGALHSLPDMAAALEAGTLGIDKVVELSRFATPETERELVEWAAESTCATIRRRADLEVRATHAETEEFERNRSLHYWHEDSGRRFGLEARMPAAQGAVVARALERAVDQMPIMPTDDPATSIEARRADALTALCSQGIAADADADRATVVVHASLEALAGRRNVETEHGAVMPPEALQRLACDARIQAVAESDAGDAVSFGRTRREPSAAMMRQLRYRDRGCRFPGCGSTAFANAHHIVWWSRGGGTDLDNLVLICGFHHRLVHEYGWTVERSDDGRVLWFRADGARYRGGPEWAASSVESDAFVDTG